MGATAWTTSRILSMSAVGQSDLPAPPCSFPAREGLLDLVISLLPNPEVVMAADIAAYVIE